VARNKSEQELRAGWQHRPGGNVTIRGGSAMSAPGKPFPWEGSISNFEMLRKALTLAELKERYKDVQVSINELEEAGIVRTTKTGKVYLATQS